MSCMTPCTFLFDELRAPAPAHLLHLSTHFCYSRLLLCSPLSKSCSHPVLNLPNFLAGPQCLRVLSCSHVVRSLTFLQPSPLPNPNSLDAWRNQASPTSPVEMAIRVLHTAPLPSPCVRSVGRSKTSSACGTHSSIASFPRCGGLRED